MLIDEMISSFIDKRFEVIFDNTILYTMKSNDSTSSSRSKYLIDTIHKQLDIIKFTIGSYSNRLK